MAYLFTSESVSEGHPDKVADQISDAILDEFLRQDPKSKVACETFCTTGLVVIGGEVRSEAYVDIQSIARRVIDRIGYNKAEYMFDAYSCGILSALHEQSPDINRGVVATDEQEQGAGDQGMMFGYACTDTEEYMPLPIALSHQALRILAQIRKEGKEMTYLRPDAKSQFTIEYSDEGKPLRIHTIVISTQHDEFLEDDDAGMQNIIRHDIENILLPRLIESLPPHTAALFKDGYILHVNPTGKFVIGGPHGDTGLTGRKIVVDQRIGMDHLDSSHEWMNQPSLSAEHAEGLLLFRGKYTHDQIHGRKSLFSAGIIHCFLSQLISSHNASLALPERVAVKMANCKQRAAIPSYCINAFIKRGISLTANMA